MAESIKRGRGRPKASVPKQASRVTKSIRLARVADELAQFDKLPDMANVGATTVDGLYGIGNSTRRRWVECGRIPAPTVIGGRCFWRAGDLRAALMKGR